MGNREEQVQEIEVLREIFPENVFTVNEDSSAPKGTVFINPLVKENLAVTVGDNKIVVEFLPPLKLLFKLEKDYPSSSPPAFLLACEWLTLEQLSSLCKKLDQLWSENQPQVILYIWIQFLQEETLSFLGITNHLELSLFKEIRRNPIQMYFSPPTHRKQSPQATKFNTSNRPPGFYPRKLPPSFSVMTTDPGTGEFDSRAVFDLANGSMLIPRIIDWNKQVKQEEFNRNWFACKVCLSDKQGGDCLRFKDCGHLYCQDCMRSYFRIQIQEGNALFLTCPEEKCPSQALPSQVYDLVGEELYERYDQLLLDSALAKMTDVTHCPRPSCQCTSVVDKESNVGSCSECQFHFCLLCKRAYHGVEPCRFKNEETNKIREEYEAADPQGKLFLEQKYGKKVLVNMLNECRSDDWVQAYTKRCPHCNASIEKSDGCNKMVCWRCDTRFCWICKQKLNAKDPYIHYNDPKSPCFGALFHGVPNDDDSDEDWDFGEFL